MRVSTKKKDIASHNEAILVQYDGEKRQYLENYKIENLRIAVAGASQIIFDDDKWNNHHVSITYELEKGHWVLKNIYLIDLIDIDNM